MFDVAVTCIGLLVLSLALISKLLLKSPLSPTFIALVFGVIVGPAVLGLLDPAALLERSVILEKAARLTLGIGLISVALRIPKSYIRHNWKEMVVLIGLGMIMMWCVSTALVYLILGVPFWLAALLGAIVTPTDPIAATPIVTGPTAENNVPERLRHAISFDSGANDALGYLFVFLPFLMLTRPAGEALGHWLTQTLLWEVALSTAFGLMLGYILARLLQSGEKRGMVMEEWRLVYTAALAFIAVGAGRLMHGDELVTVFAAGAMFTQVVSATDRNEEELGQEAVNRFFSIPIFALLGIMIPWQGWLDLGWQGVSLAIAVILLRRPLALLLLKPLLPSVRSRADLFYMGWFGPVAVAAIYYAAMMEQRLSNPFIWEVISLVIAVSVVLHGFTAVPFTRLYGRVSGQRRSAESEN